VSARQGPSIANIQRRYFNAKAQSRRVAKQEEAGTDLRFTELGPFVWIRVDSWFALRILSLRDFATLRLCVFALKLRVHYISLSRRNL
jgi:hypothetical protein